MPLVRNSAIVDVDNLALGGDVHSLIPVLDFAENIMNVAKT